MPWRAEVSFLALIFCDVAVAPASRSIGGLTWRFWKMRTEAISMAMVSSGR